MPSNPMVSTVLSVAVVALLAATGWSAPAPSATSALTVPDPAPRAEAAGTLELRIGPTRQVIRVRLEGLAPRAGYALRLPSQEADARLAFARADRRGRARMRVRSDHLPADVSSLLANRPAEIVEYQRRSSRSGATVLEGRIPIVAPFPYWTEPSPGGGDPGGGGTGGETGGGVETPTRLADPAADGPWAVSSATFSLPTAAGGLAPGATVVWYPGAGAVVTPDAAPYPPVVLVHAFQLNASSYAGWGQKLASWGFVVVVPNHADPLLLPDNEKEVRTVLGVMDWLVAQNGDPQSRFHGRIDVQRFGLVGHSLGGGAALVAGTRQATQGRVKAAVGLAPAGLTVQTGLFATPTPVLPDATTGYWPPTLVVTGSRDAIVAPATSRSLYFTAGPSPHAVLRIAGHCHMNYADSLPSLAALGSDYDARTCVAPAVQLAEARAWTISWLLHHLRSDARARDWADGTVAAERTNLDEATFQ